MILYFPVSAFSYFWIEISSLVLLLLIADAVLFYMVADVMEKNRLRKGIQEIAAGNMSYQIPIEPGLHGENKTIALMINGIGTGLKKAVAEAMKNERLKTDLITNVSHDIKTPLTSILNYVGILRQTDPADPKVQDYLEYSEEKAQRLKTLTEDVVEASKVSSGNISLEYMDLGSVGNDPADAGRTRRKIRGEKSGDRHRSSGRTGCCACRWKKNVACPGKYLRKCSQVRNAWNKSLCDSENR